ncbi:alpha/beta hydrolase [Streptomyces sp. WAC06614]|uniref:alpha/beta hydrolase n=1 Tax=Streptomyces sp. WAC06614 TaxID=2487416 RepID=UPI0021AE4195|nr:alpha/beta hydrolase [Streptomyces sp. WAC06614]
MDWKSCREAEGFDCATAKVPLDYRSPRERTIELAVVKRKATGPGRRIGTLFFNPGGPGGPGTKELPLWYKLFPREVRERFDIVSWDPRGVGDSTPVRCFASPEEAAKWQERIPAGFPVGERQRQTWTEAYAELGRRCEQRDAQLLRHVSTADTARDLDRLRQAVGDPQLTYLGISYGTFLGATYANLFPGRVRAMVLDGNATPSSWVDGGSRSEPRLGTFLRVGSDLGSAATLKQFLTLCGRATAERCPFSAGTPGATLTKFHELMGRIQKQPQGTWTYGKTIHNVVTRLYFQTEWDGLATALQDLWQRRTPADEAPPTDTALYAVLCPESPNPRDPRSYEQQERTAVARSGDTAHEWAWVPEPCATWPATAAHPYTGPWNRPTAHPILLVNPTYDPATPYSAAQAMARELADARLLTLNSYGHTALLNPSSCVSAYESRYFIDGVLPSSGTTCQPDTTPFTGPKPREGLHTGGGALARVRKPTPRA